MALRIGDYVISGELRNTRRNGVYGWVEFAPNYGIRIELTGNFAQSLAGKHIRFRIADADEKPELDIEDLPEPLDVIADRQIGVVGEVYLRHAEDAGDKTGQCLCLEWFSQNGQVVAEIMDPNLEFVTEQKNNEADDVEPELLPNGGYGIGFTEIHIDDEGVAHAEHYELGGEEEDEDEEELEAESEEEDPYGLFGEDLNEKVAESLGGLPASAKDDWQEFMPEIWNEIFEGKKDEPISYLFKTPLKLPKPEHVQDEEEAKLLVRSILAQLALLSVALDVCEHFSQVDTYRLLMNEILPTAKVHPNLAESEMVQHYSTTDFCSVCEAEMEAEYRDSEKPEPADEGESSDNDPPEEDES